MNMGLQTIAYYSEFPGQWSLLKLLYHIIFSFLTIDSLVTNTFLSMW